jgi:uncharacterized protein involved in exopolysaccharide biosynthesis
MSQANNNRAVDQILIFKNTVRHYAGWIVLGAILLSIGGAAFLLLLPDHYKASTTILVDPQKVPEKYVSPTVSSDPAQRLSTITQQVLSATRLQQIIDSQCRQAGGGGGAVGPGLSPGGGGLACLVMAGPSSP